MEKEKYISLDEAFKAVLGYVISNIELLEKTVSQSEKGELVVREEKGMDFDREGEFYNRETFIFRREWFKYALSAKSPGDCLRALIVLLKYGFDRELPPYDSGEFANGILEIAQNQIEEDWRRYEEKLDRKLENRLELEHKKERMANLPLSPEEEKFAKIFGDGTEWQKYEIRAIMQFIGEITGAGTGKPTKLAGVDLSELVKTVYSRFVYAAAAGKIKDPIKYFFAGLKNEVVGFFEDNLTGYRYEIEQPAEAHGCGKLVKIVNAGANAASASSPAPVKSKIKFEVEEPWKEEKNGNE